MISFSLMYSNVGKNNNNNKKEMVKADVERQKLEKRVYIKRNVFHYEFVPSIFFSYFK